MPVLTSLVGGPETLAVAVLATRVSALREGRFGLKSRQRSRPFSGSESSSTCACPT